MRAPVELPRLRRVVDPVGRGRAPHQTWWRQWSAADEEAVRATGMTDLAHRAVDELSGGGSGPGSRWPSPRAHR